MKRAPVTFTRLLRHGAARHLAAWQHAGQQYGRFAGEVWQLRLPLMTMVGLTLLGVYDCTAATRLSPAETAAPTVQVAPAEPAVAVLAATPVAAARMAAFDPTRLGLPTRPAVSAAQPMAAAFTAMTRWTGYLPAATAPPQA